MSLLNVTLEFLRIELDSTLLLGDEIIELSIISSDLYIHTLRKRTSVPSMRRISLLSLLTIVFVFLS